MFPLADSPDHRPAVPQQSLSQATEQRRYRRSAALYLHTAQDITVTITDEHAQTRLEQEAFIRDIYKIVHDAEIEYFMPNFLSMRNASRQLLGICGLRYAGEGNLFLEHYLDSPVEQVLSLANDKAVSRKNIVEVGNLAVSNPLHIRCLLASLNAHLHTTDTEWAVFTGINTLFNSLKRLNVPMHILGKADLERLPAGQHAVWGSYYDENPQVIAVQRFQPQVLQEHSGI